MAQHLQRCLIILFLLAEGFAQLAPGDRVVTIVADRVVVRSEPEIRPGTILTHANRGAQLKWLGERNGWYQVELPAGRQGWVMGDFVQVEAARNRVEVQVPAVRVRQGPGTSFPVAGRLAEGDQVPVLEYRDGWFRVQLPEGGEGYLREDTVVPRLLEGVSLETLGVSALAEEGAPPSPSAGIAGRDAGAPAPPPSVPSQSLSGEAVSPGVSSERGKTALPEDAGGPEEGAAEPVGIPASEAEPVPESPPQAPALPPPVPESFQIPQAAWWIAAGVLLLAALLWVRSRRRGRVARMDPRIRIPQRDLSLLGSPPAGADRSLRAAIEESRRKREKLERELSQRLSALQASASAETSLEEVQDLKGRLEDLQRLVLAQQEKVRIYAELLALQNQQLEALKEENSALLRLSQGMSRG